LLSVPFESMMFASNNSEPLRTGFTLARTLWEKMICSLSAAGWARLVLRAQARLVLLEVLEVVEVDHKAPPLLEG